MKQMMPDQLAIKWDDDLENVKYEINYKGLTDREYAQSVDLSEPIDVVYDGEQFYIDDGHHRYYAAKILNKPLNVNLEIKSNPLKKLAPDVGYDDFHRNIWKEVHGMEEGVGDKYFEKVTGISPEISYFHNQVRPGGEEMIKTAFSRIVKNPKSLDNIGPYVRGVIDKDGNLYLEEKSDTLHDFMLRELSTKGHFKYVEDWDWKIPTEFITIHRIGDSKDFVVGESNLQMRPEELRFEMEDAPTREEAKPYFQKFIDLANQKHPFANFINELSIYYDQGSYEEMMNLNENEESNLLPIQDLPFKEEVEVMGGDIYAVGGSVRDTLIGRPSKDLDIIVRGVPADDLEKILAKYGSVKLVGESFGVYKFVPKGGGDEIDIALPRTEISTGPGHKDFKVVADHKLPIEKDLARRDITINALAQDMDNNIIDLFGGQEDIKNKRIKGLGESQFIEDPLRMLRAIRFASVLGFEIDPETLNLIKNNAESIKNITPERILIEFEKIARQGDKMKGAKLLQDSGLFRNIFGFELDTSNFQDLNFQNTRTVGEFLYALMRNQFQPHELYKQLFVKSEDDVKRGKIFKEIKALDKGLSSERDFNSPFINRMKAFNMYNIYPPTLESRLLPQKLQTAAMELLMGRYPKTDNELAINGHDLMNLGFQGEEIGKKKIELLKNIYADNIRNNREDLLNLVGNKSPDDIPEVE